MRESVSASCAREWGAVGSSDTYHKFVKTTPKPRATKKRSGELVGPPPPPLPSPVGEAEGETVVVVEVVVADIVAGSEWWVVRRGGEEEAGAQ